MSLGLEQCIRRVKRKKKIEQKNKTAVVAVYSLFTGEYIAAIYLRAIPCHAHEFEVYQ